MMAFIGVRVRAEVERQMSCHVIELPLEPYQQIQESRVFAVRLKRCEKVERPDP
jgi:hypothetical protein